MNVFLWFVSHANILEYKNLRSKNCPIIKIKCYLHRIFFSYGNFDVQKVLIEKHFDSVFLIKNINT